MRQALLSAPFTEIHSSGGHASRVAKLWLLQSNLWVRSCRLVLLCTCASMRALRSSRRQQEVRPLVHGPDVFHGGVANAEETADWNTEGVSGQAKCALPVKPVLSFGKLQQRFCCTVAGYGAAPASGGHRSAGQSGFRAAEERSTWRQLSLLMSRIRRHALRCDIAALDDSCYRLSHPCCLCAVCPELMLT